MDTEDLLRQIAKLQQEKEKERQEKEKERQEKEKERQEKEKERQLRLSLEAVTLPTTFLRHLFYCYSTLYQGISVQTDSSRTSSGGLTKVDGKFYPRELRYWTDFTALHDKCFESLSRQFSQEKLFASLASIQAQEDNLTPTPLAEEADLNPFMLIAIESRVKAIMKIYLSRAPNKASRVTFRAGAYSVPKVPETSQTPEISAPEPAAFSATGSTTPRGRKLTRNPSKRPAGSPPAESSPSPSKRTSPERATRPDRFCLRVDQEDKHTQLFIVEFKAAHKLTPKILKLALDGTSPDRTIFPDATNHKRMKSQATISVKARARNKVAQVLAQAFHYMIDGAHTYSYITSGEAFIFLHIDLSCPTILHYFISFPEEKIALPPMLDHQLIDDDTFGTHVESLKHTPIALVLSLVLLAFDKEPLLAEEKQALLANLSRWPNPYSDVDALDTLPSRLDTSRVLLPPVAEQQQCREPEKPHRRDDDDDNDHAHGSSSRLGSKPSTTSLPSNSPTVTTYRPAPGATMTSTGKQTQSRTASSNLATLARGRRSPFQSYCTIRCLQGLKMGGALDEKCPNIKHHRYSNLETSRHQICPTALAALLQEQVEANLDDGCEALDGFGKFGAIGVLFKLTLYPYGYTFVGKGVQRAHWDAISHELSIYNHLEGLQGKFIPVCLGRVNLRREYIVGSGAYICSMLLMSYVGEKISGRDENLDDMWQQALDIIYSHGVDHGDDRHPNALWSEEKRCVMVIDFDRASIFQSKRQRWENSEDIDSEVGGSDRSPKLIRVL